MSAPENVTYERLKRVIKKEGYAARLKYLRGWMLPVAEKLYWECANDLLAHVRELVELENAVNFRRDASVVLVLTDAELAAFAADEARHGVRGGFVCHDEGDDARLVSEDVFSEDPKAACWRLLDAEG